ncbi:Glycosyl hydrolase [Phytophthora megakarya]|uniref:cellulose 1,4-beta-cellobiosidase (non-reducing end) n=1 Tax=Phytophthora megakarya TaxID=4795 RepID=A0A225UF89_9STRA|nr:Glycosyl hydrolase [Phytophthora megakarya]
MNSLTDDQCSAAKTEFGDEDDHKAKGGLAQMGLAMKRGMVLTMSLWTDNAAYCLWLDSDYPVTADASEPGVARGTCATTTGIPDDVISEQPDATVVFSNIRFGDIGTTHGLEQHNVHDYNVFRLFKFYGYVYDDNFSVNLDQLHGYFNFY